MKIVWDDTFLRSFVDKKTGKTTFQVYQRFAYTSSGWRFYQSANYESDTGLKSTEVTKIGSDVDCSYSRYSGCTYYETIGFEVDELVLRSVANKFSLGALTAWKIRFKSKAGVDSDQGLVAAEVSGLLAVVDRYRRSLDEPQK